MTSSGTCEYDRKRGGKHGKEVLTQAEVPGGHGIAARRKNGWSSGQDLWGASQFSQRLEAPVYGERSGDFAQDGTVAEYERRIADLEQLLGKKEVEIALLKNFLGRTT